MEGTLLLALQAIRIDGLTQLICVFYALGNRALLWLFIAVIMFPFASKRATSVLVIISVVITSLLVSLLIANIVARPHPSDEVAGLMAVQGVSRSGFAFPSAIAATSFAAALCMGRTLGSGWGTSSFIMAVLVSFSTLYLGVNYPSDVVVGAVVGCVVAQVVTFTYQRVFGEVRRRGKRSNGKHSL